MLHRPHRRLGKVLFGVVAAAAVGLTAPAAEGAPRDRHKAVARHHHPSAKPALHGRRGQPAKARHLRLAREASAPRVLADAMAPRAEEPMPAANLQFASVTTEPLAEFIPAAKTGTAAGRAGLGRLVIGFAQAGFLAILLVLAAYTLRHWLFTLNRLFRPVTAPYADIDTADWPEITVFIAAHNEEAVIANCLEALLDVDYPRDRLHLVPVNDRSADGTRAIIDGYVARFPGRIAPFHRSSGKAGKAAALKDAMAYAQGDIIIVFDADYIPGRNLLKQLVAPFFDPEVGAVMGRVVPLNAASNLLTRLLDLERSAGYQVDQQARMNLSLVPQYGGTVGGIRRSAMAAAGGWHDDVLAEDTDITYRLLLRGWRTVYVNRAECYEEVPEAWPVRIRQIGRWSKGHNQALARHLAGLIRSPRVPLATKVDGALLLGVFALPAVISFGLVLTLVLYFADAGLAGAAIASIALVAFGALGNFAAFFQIAAAAILDGYSRRLRLLPFNLLAFVISTVAIFRATLHLLVHDWLLKREMVWDKTVRYRRPGAAL